MNSFADLVRVQNKHTGQIGRISRAVFENPRLNPGILVEVDETVKPRLAKFYRSEFLANDETPETAPLTEEEDDD